MARPLRIEYHGAIYHVTARGNEHGAIFRSAADRVKFLTKLSELRAVHHVEVLAYAQMSNHYHLVVCTPRGNLTAFMQQFQTSYTVYFNHRHGRAGHLFAGRYKSQVVEGGHYLLRLTKYVHLNPVKTRQAADLDAEEKRRLLRSYRWSSLPGYAGLGAPENWVTYRALDAFGDKGTGDTARQAYLAYVEQGLGDDDEGFLQTLTESSRACGSEAFRREVEARFREETLKLDRYVDIANRGRQSPVPVEVVTAAVTAAYGVTEQQLTKRGNREAKDVWMRLLHEEAGLTQRDIGALVGHSDGGTVSRCLARLAATLAEDAEASARYAALRPGIADHKA